MKLTTCISTVPIISTTPKITPLDCIPLNKKFRKASLSSLGEDELVHLLSFVPRFLLLQRICLVSKKWYSLCLGPGVWECIRLTCGSSTFSIPERLSSFVKEWTIYLLGGGDSELELIADAFPKATSVKTLDDDKYAYVTMRGICVTYLIK